jgi:Kef-type K+ transport system membrane component KefB
MDPWALVGTWLTFAIVACAARPLGSLVPLVGLPLITGYLITGAVAGPFALGLIKKADLQPLSLITQFALAFISFSAGAELYLPELRSLFKRILYSTTAIAIVTFTCCTGAILALGSGGGVVPFMEALPFGCRLSVAAIAASIMVARSPASAIAVVKELRAKGPFVSTTLGITVLGDVFVLLLFTLTTTVAESQCKGEGFSIIALGITVAVIIASIIIGWAVGHLLLVLMLFKRLPTRYLILPLGLAIFVACHAFTDWSVENLPYVVSLEPLLVCITAGYVCSNKSRHRHRFIGVLQQAGPWVFLPFFTFTGASLDLRVMVQSLGFAVIVASLRALCIYIGSSSGGFLAGERPFKAPPNQYMWMTLLTQAGVSLGLASEVGMSFPTWGRSFQSAIIAVVLVNQLIGPVLFKVAVRKMGEAGKGATSDAHDVDAAVPAAVLVGYTPSGVAVGLRLLSDHWTVTMVCGSEVEASAARAEVAAYAEEVRGGREKDRSAAEVAVAGLKAAAADVAGKATGVAAAAMAAVTGTAPVEQLHDEHEPQMRIEDGFKAVIGLAEATVASTPSLAAVVFCASDASNHDAAQRVGAVIRAAPKRSSLHGARQLALVHSLPWAPVFEGMGIMPVHAGLHATHLAAKLLSSQRGKPVVVLPASRSAEEASHALSALLGQALWKFGGTPLDAPPEVTVDEGAGGGSAPVAAADALRGVRDALAAEDVGEWARDEYVDGLHELDENSGAGGEAAGVSSEDVAMFGVLGGDHDGHT